MIMLLELIVFGSALILPVVTVIAIYNGKRTVGIASLIVGTIAVFLYGFDMGFQLHAREASRRFREKIEKPLQRIVSHMQNLSAQGRTNDLDLVPDFLGETDLHLFPVPNRPQPDLMDVFDLMPSELQRPDATTSSDGNSPPSGGLPESPK